MDLSQFMSMSDADLDDLCRQLAPEHAPIPICDEQWYFQQYASDYDDDFIRNHQNHEF